MVPGNASVLMGEVSASVQLVSTLPVARMLSIRGQPLASTLDVVVLRIQLTQEWQVAKLHC